MKKEQKLAYVMGDLEAEFSKALVAIEKKEKDTKNNNEKATEVLNKLEKENRINDNTNILEIIKNVKHSSIKQKDKELIDIYTDFLNISMVKIFSAINTLAYNKNIEEMYEILARFIFELTNNSYYIGDLIDKKNMTTYDLNDIIFKYKSFLDNLKHISFKIIIKSNLNEKKRMKYMKDIDFIERVFSQLIITQILYVK